MLSTITDVAQQVADGVIGLIDTVKIGDLVVSALEGLSSPSVSYVTRKPVQAGYVMTDAVVDEPKTIEMTILLADPEISAEAGLDAALTGDLSGLTDSWRDKKTQLYKYMTEREIIDVQDHVEVTESMVITSIDPIYDVNENQDAFIAIVTLVQIRQIDSGSATGIDSLLEDVGIL